MSRSLARHLHTIFRIATMGQSAPRAAQTRARLIDLLQQDGTVDVPVQGQMMRILAYRGPHIAAAAAQFVQEEPELQSWIDTFSPHDVFWDIGSAGGMFTLYAALTRGVQVVAFEPNATSYALLTEHLALNNLGGRVTALNVAFSDRTGLTALDLATMLPGSGGNSLAGIEGQFGKIRPVFSQTVLSYTVDEFRRGFTIPAPTHIKIDVDGAEGEILAGAEETLGTVTSVMVEVEGLNAIQADSRIDKPLRAAGLHEVLEVRAMGSKRNRLFRR